MIRLGNGVSVGLLITVAFGVGVLLGVAVDALLAGWLVVGDLYVFADVGVWDK